MSAVVNIQVAAPTVLNDLGYKTIGERMTPELIFAVVEPIGGGVDKVISTLESVLKTTRFNYDINNIRVSKLIESECNESIETLLGKEIEPSLNGQEILSPAFKRIYKLQRIGNILRERNGSDFLAKKIIQSISEYRGSIGNGVEQASGGVPVAKPIRVAHIIKSLKNTEELSLLKSVYGNMLILIAVSGNYQENLENYRKNSTEATKTEFDHLTTIDQDEGIKHGQQVRDVFYKADIFLNTESAEKKLNDFLQVLFGQKLLSPTTHEKMMFEAFSASLNSTCLSRQVGAAIADQCGELLSIGWNDVPAFGGGLATTERHCDELCCTKKYCNSNREIKKLQSKIINVIIKIQKNTLNTAIEKIKKQFSITETLPEAFIDGIIAQVLDEYDFKKLAKDTGISGLIEFSRAIHAEMEAILSAARTAKHGLLGGIIYVTTFPCENCVKHILAAGITEVVYIEPYPKSRAVSFFSQLVVDGHDMAAGDPVEKRLKFSQFTGISPQAYLKLFRKNSERKNAHGELSLEKDGGLPQTNVLLDGYYIYESYIAEQLSKESQNEKGK